MEERVGRLCVPLTFSGETPLFSDKIAGQTAPLSQMSLLLLVENGYLLLGEENSILLVPMFFIWPFRSPSIAILKPKP